MVAVSDKKEGARVYLDDNPIDRSCAGNDIYFEDNDTYIELFGAKMFNVVLADDSLMVRLKLDVPKGVKIYSFTFDNGCN